MPDLSQVISAQRKERDILLSRSYKPRSMVDQYKPLLASHEIKIITGPRRAGKSTMALLMLHNTNFAYLNFDDNNLLDSWDEDNVTELLSHIYTDYDYLMLDEVQNLDGWHLWVSKLYRQGVNMVITGSNAHMLGSEMATSLTGRYLRIEVYTLSLSEVLDWQDISTTSLNENGNLPQVQAIATSYLLNGGYPETILSPSICSNYLSTLFDAIIWKDVARRHKVRNVTDLGAISSYLLTLIACPVTYNSVAEAVGLNSVTTAKKFMTYLEEPYLFFFLSRYDNKLRLMNRAPRKVYIADNGFVRAKAFALSDNIGRMLENQVFVELLRRGYDTERTLFYYRSRNDKEVDFVTRHSNQIERLIQVCADMSNPKTERREVTSIVECASELKCDNLTIVTLGENRTINYSHYEIQVIPIYLF